MASYFEWIQGKTGNVFEREYLERRMEGIMKDAFKRVWKANTEDMRSGAYIIAVKRILKAEKARGNL